MRFPDYLKQQAAAAIASIPAKEVSDIYAVSFLIDNEGDDPRQPILVIGYNTEPQVEQTILSGQASDPAEARWNYAFWLQNELAAIGDSTRDPAGATARRRWIEDLGLWYDEPADPGDWLTIVGPLARQIEVHFNQACSQLARALHTTGAITATLGRPVPVLVHELEYYEQIALRTEEANPPGLASPFTSWVRNG